MLQAPTIYPLRERVRVEGTAQTEEIVRSVPVQAGWTWLVLGYAAEDEDSASTSLRIFVESGGQRYLVAEQTSPAAATLYHDNTLQVLGEGDRFGARFTGTVNGDDLVLYVHGLMLPPGVPCSPELAAQFSLQRR